MNKRIGIVVPWYGEALRGGAETVARQVALRLAARGHTVEVLTTCCRSFLDDWAVNHLPEGSSADGPIRVSRFPVDPRDAHAFNSANGFLLGLPPHHFSPGLAIPDPGFVPHNLHSAALVRHVVDHAAEYHRVLFTPYLYGPILRGAPAVAERAVLQPCLHDESYAYLEPIHAMFQTVRRCAFLSHGEADLAERIYGPAVIDGSIVVGSGIESEELTTSVAAGADSPLIPEGPFLLYLGRRDATKGADLLIDGWRRYQAAHPGNPLALVLAGPGPKSYTDHALRVTDLGLVNAATKAALLRGCLALVHPSRNESYSRSLMEAWHCGRPAVVHAHCPATAGAMARAGAGWLASEDPDAWAQAIECVAVSTQAERDAFGSRGVAYAAEHADWERCIDRYEQLLDLAPTTVATIPLRARLGRIDQVLTGFDLGDAISEEALTIQRWLRSHGWLSDIVAQYIQGPLRSACVPWRTGLVNPSAGIIYHHSIGSEIATDAIAHPGPKALIYHNITPPKFFTAYKPELAKMLQDGLDHLPSACASFPHLWADSAFNARELAVAAGRPVEVLPLSVPPAKWAVTPDQGLLAALRRDQVRNVLFVGRVAPNKCQHDLVRMFWHLLRMGVNARLCLVGQVFPGDPYVEEVQSLAANLGIASRVWMPNKITVSELTAVWKVADVFVSLSEHEGFGVPLVEAMLFGVPVVAFSCTAIAETLGGVGVLMPDKGDLVETAATVETILEDANLSAEIVARQRVRRMDFLPAAIEKRYETLIGGAFH